MWSVGFGYGFWWSLIAGNDATRASLSRLQEDAHDVASAITARLQAVQAELNNVVNWSESQMAREEQSGGSCGVPSSAGRGPLYNARVGVRDFAPHCATPSPIPGSCRCKRITLG